MAAKMTLRTVNMMGYFLSAYMGLRGRAVFPAVASKRVQSNSGDAFYGSRIRDQLC